MTIPVACSLSKIALFIRVQQDSIFAVEDSQQGNATVVGFRTFGARI